jgi:hypothetical protein
MRTPKARRTGPVCFCGASGLLLTVLLGGCQSLPASPTVSNTVPESFKAPQIIHRLVVLYPATTNRDVRDAYSRLEAEVFTLKDSRPDLRVVDRLHLPAILREQQFQMRGEVSEDTAVRVGRVLGVDAVLLYQVEGPTLRDVVLARFSGDVPPVVITSRVILVETAEVAFHNVVTSPVLPVPESIQSEVRAALQRAITRTTSDLRLAFR